MGVGGVGGAAQLSHSESSSLFNAFYSKKGCWGERLSGDLPPLLMTNASDTPVVWQQQQLSNDSAPFVGTEPSAAARKSGTTNARQSTSANRRVERSSACAGGLEEPL